MKSEKVEVLADREALIEMYKAGFLDAYQLSKKLKKEKDWLKMNEKYKDCFFARFEKKLIKTLKLKK